MTLFLGIMLSVTALVGEPYYSAAAMDVQSGQILFSKNAAERCYPASCTKLMTLVLAIESVKSGKVSLDDVVKTTRLSSLEKPSVSGIRPPGAMKLSDLFKVLMIKSANDVAVMIADHVAKAVHPEAATEEARLAAFVSDMNKKAKSFNMHSTHYATPNGYPPPPGSKRGFDSSTALDMLKLGREIVTRYPEVLAYTSLKKCVVYDKRGVKYSYSSHNNVMANPKIALEGVDGLKTGFHDAGGYSLLLSASRNGKRALVAVMGCKDLKVRDANARKLMDDALTAISF